MEESIIEILESYEVSNWDLHNITGELLKLFNVKDSFVEEYVEHCIMCRENGLPMLDWHSYQKQYCI